MGAPNQPELQARVLEAALGLFQAEQGPVLVDFPEEAPSSEATDEQDTAWVCPVSFAARPDEESELERLISSFREEVAELRPWYDLGFERRGRTAMAEFDPGTATEMLAIFLQNQAFETGQGQFSDAVALRLAAQDVKAYYFEAAISKPGAEVPDSQAFGRWFWHQTSAGLVLKRIKKMCSKSDDNELRMTGKMFLVPMN